MHKFAEMTKRWGGGKLTVLLVAVALPTMSHIAAAEDLYFCPNANGEGLSNWNGQTSDYGWWIGEGNWTNALGVAKKPTSSDVVWFYQTPTNTVNPHDKEKNVRVASGSGTVYGIVYTNSMATKVEQGTVTLKAGGCGVKIVANTTWNADVVINGAGEVPFDVPEGKSFNIQKKLTGSSGILVKRGAGELMWPYQVQRDFNVAGIRMEGGSFSIGTVNDSGKHGSFKKNTTAGFTLTFANNDSNEVFTLMYDDLMIENLTIVETEDVDNTGHGFTSPANHNLAYLGGTSTVNPMSFTGSFKGSAGLVWAPANSDTEIVLKKAAHPTTGGIWVSNGVVRVSERASFLNLTKVAVAGSGATFAVDASANQMFPAAAFEISNGGKVRSEAGANVVVASLAVDGEPVESGVYSGESWMAGTGWTLTVLPIAAGTDDWLSSVGPLAQSAGLTPYASMTFDAAADTALTAADGALVTLGAGGLTTLTGAKTITLGWPLSLDGAQKWKIASGDTVEQTGAISTVADGRLLIDAAGATVNLRAANSFVNELFLSNGTFHVWNDRAFGSGAGATKLDLYTDTTVTFHGVTIDDDIEVTRMRNKQQRFVFAANTTNVLNGALVVGRQDSSNSGNFYPTVESGAVLICRGGVTKSAGLFGSGGDGTLIITNKTLSTPRLSSDGGSLVLAVPGNFLGSNAGSVSNLYTTVPYAINATDFRLKLSESSMWDMCGNDQRMGVFAEAGNGIVTSESPVWLHMVDDEDARAPDKGITSRVTRVCFQGAVNWSKEGLLTNWVMNASTSTGILAVAKGRLVMTGPDGGKVTIDEKTGAQYGRSAGSWTNATAVQVTGGTLAIEHSKAFGAQTAMEISGDGQVELSAGVRQDVSTLTLDGVPQRGGSYGGPDSSALNKPTRGDGTYWFSGRGRLRVGGVSDGMMIIFQ